MESEFCPNGKSEHFLSISLGPSPALAVASAYGRKQYQMNNANQVFLLNLGAF